MEIDNFYKKEEKLNIFRVLYFSPITEEGLLIGISIVVILILVGLIFGIFNWVSGAVSSLFDQIGFGF